LVSPKAAPPGRSRTGLIAVARYGVAVVSVGAALAVRLALAPLVGDRGVYLVLLLAVAVTGSWAGFRPALLATALGCLAAIYFFVPPKYSFSIASWGDVTLLICFVAAALSISTIMHRLSQARDRLAREAGELERLKAELEGREEERTEELRKKAALLVEAERVSRVGSWERMGVQMTWSDEVYRIYGLSPEEFRPTYEGFLERILPEDRDRVRVIVDRSYRSKEPFEVTHRIRRPDGTVRTLRARGRVEPGPSGDTLRAYGTTQDVTEELEFEERSRALALRESRARELARAAELEAVMESVPAAIWITRDREARTIVGNAFSYEILGMSQGENVSKGGPGGTNAYDAYVDGRKLDAAELPIQRAAATGRPVLGHEQEIRRADGKSRWIYGNAVPIFGDDGRVSQVVAAFVDVTERKRAEEKIRELNADLERRVHERTRGLEEAIHELEAFSYSVAHDLRAPLRAMKGFADLVIEDAGGRLQAQERDYLARITEAAGRMDALVGSLLAYSRLSRDTLVTNPVQLAALVGDVLRQMTSELQERNARLVVEAGIPDVLGHAPSLNQAVTNLVSNAVKFVPPGVAPQVRIAAQTRTGFVRLWVEDNGIGIAPEHQERIFHVFEKLHRPEVYPGTGIGLATVKRAIEKMGGQVGVESKPGQGSRFWLELPQAEPVSRVPDPRAAGGGAPKSDFHE
jgi:PAS domain S-box-containing protein